MSDYREFVARKLALQPPTGIDRVPDLHESLFPHQRDLVRWALRRGRAAIFANTGLGKTAMQLEWARVVCEAQGGSVLVLAPLAVAEQTVKEGRRIGVDVTLCREASDVRPGVNVTNYDRLHRFDPSAFVGVVLDESSCIKHHDASTLRTLLDAFARTAFKLCATATPAPNDWTELGTHAEFLGICTRTEMLSEFFCHDGGETQVWRLKGHARAQFWRWVASWGALVQRPSDLGYDDAGYALPPLAVQEHVILCSRETATNAGVLFVSEAKSLMDRRAARKASTMDRVTECARMVNADDLSGEPWIVWCDLNAESEALTKAIPGAVEVRGSDPVDVKAERLRAFSEGRVRVLVTKPSIAGFGLNWQHCARVAFVGVTDSWESYYQAVRRCWRFGQSRPVAVHIFASEAEGAVLANLRRKEEDARRMGDALATETSATVRAAVLGAVRETNTYAASKRITVPHWLKTEEVAA